MDITLSDKNVTSIDGLDEGTTYAMQVTQFNYTGVIGYTQATSTPSTFFWGRGFKFKVKSGHTVYVRAGKVPEFPINIHIEEV